VVRILRRTVDLLSQVPYCEAISEQLRSKARAALKSINRFPVCEIEDLFATGKGQLDPAIERPQS
jgi:superfamily II RNA helicase